MPWRDYLHVDEAATLASLEYIIAEEKSRKRRIEMRCRKRMQRDKEKTK